MLFKKNSIIIGFLFCCASVVVAQKKPNTGAKSFFPQKNCVVLGVHFVYSNHTQHLILEDTPTLQIAGDYRDAGISQLGIGAQVGYKFARRVMLGVNAAYLWQPKYSSRSDTITATHWNVGLLARYYIAVGKRVDVYPEFSYGLGGTDQNHIYTNQAFGLNKPDTLKKTYPLLGTNGYVGAGIAYHISPNATLDFSGHYHWSSESGTGRVRISYFNYTGDVPAVLTRTGLAFRLGFHRFF